MRAGRGPVAPCSKALNLCRFHARLVILCIELAEHHAELTCSKAWNLCSFHMWLVVLYIEIAERHADLVLPKQDGQHTHVLQVKC